MFLFLVWKIAYSTDIFKIYQYPTSFSVARVGWHFTNGRQQHFFYW